MDRSPSDSSEAKGTQATSGGPSTLVLQLRLQDPDHENASTALWEAPAGLCDAQVPMHLVLGSGHRLQETHDRFKDILEVRHQRWHVFEDETGGERSFNERYGMHDESSSACSVRHALHQSSP